MRKHEWTHERDADSPVGLRYKYVLVVVAHIPILLAAFLKCIGVDRTWYNGKEGPWFKLRHIKLINFSFNLTLYKAFYLSSLSLQYVSSSVWAWPPCLAPPPSRTPWQFSLFVTSWISLIFRPTGSRSLIYLVRAPSTCIPPMISSVEPSGISLKRSDGRRYQSSMMISMVNSYYLHFDHKYIWFIS